MIAQYLASCLSSDNLLLLANATYAAGNPILPDASYDAIETPTYRKVGHTPNVGKTKHTIQMGSLDKAQSFADLRKWYKPSYGKLFVSVKLDGISVDMRNSLGVLQQALTRGDGTHGEDVTSNALVMKGVRKRLLQPFTGHVRGEILVTKEDFTNHFESEGAANSRNSAAGAAKRSDDTKARHCTVLCYRALPHNGWIATKAEEYALIESLGLSVPEHYVCDTLEEVEEIYQEYIEIVRDSLAYDIDGLVVEINDNEIAQNVLKDPSHPEYAIAYKFPHETAETTLEEIVAQVGFTGRVVPVAVFKPVNLVKAWVSRASLATWGFVSGMNLGKGDVILVSRRNDVIPKVEKVIRHMGGPKFHEPYGCPACGWQLEEEGEYLICPNIGICPAQVQGSVLNWLKKIGVLEWGEAVITALHESNRLNDISDLYRINTESLAELETGGKRVGASNARTMISRLSGKMELPLHVFIGALGIKGMGRTMCKALVDAGYDTLERMQAVSQRELTRIPGMGETRAADFVAGLAQRNGLISKLQTRGIRITAPKTGKLNGMSFCMTGFRDAELAEAIESQGGTIKSSVGQGLTYLIQKDAESHSDKTRKALSYGTKIIDISTAWKMIK